MKKLAAAITVILLSACAGLPTERLAGMRNFELCERLAVYHHKGHAEHFMASLNEMRRRNLSSAEIEDCVITAELTLRRMALRDDAWVAFGAAMQQLPAALEPALQPVLMPTPQRVEVTGEVTVKQR